MSGSHCLMGSRKQRHRFIRVCEGSIGRKGRGGKNAAKGEIPFAIGFATWALARRPVNSRKQS